jgi:hypothetical protein
MQQVIQKKRAAYSAIHAKQRLRINAQALLLSFQTYPSRPWLIVQSVLQPKAKRNGL